MPHFSPEGNDMYICQICGRDLDSAKHPPSWRIDLTKRQSAGNVCPTCLARLEPATANTQISLYEHCKQESGLTNHNDILKYMNRHYGHG